MLGLTRQRLQASCRRVLLQNANQRRRWIGYGHDMHSEMIEGTNKTSVLGYDEDGYVVNNINYRSGVILFPEMTMLWKPKRFEDITKESLAIFTVANPPVEILVLGCGPKLQLLDPSIKQYLNEHGIVVEYVDSMNACATFNILNAEDRLVAAAILPADPTTPSPKPKQTAISDAEDQAKTKSTGSP